MRLLLLTLLLAAIPHVARAQCAQPAAISPRNMELPQHATLFVSRDQTLDHRPDADVPVFIHFLAGSGTYTITPVAPSIVRIDLAAELDASPVINGQGYSVNAQPYLVRDPAVGSLQRARGHGPATTWDDLTVSLVRSASVAAVRADWNFRGTRATYWAVPQSLDNDLSSTEVDFGTVSCGGTTIAPSEMAAGGTLTLSAVLVDGSTRVLAKNIEISDTALPVHEVQTQIAHDEVAGHLGTAEVRVAASSSLTKVDTDAQHRALEARIALALLFLAGLLGRVASGAIAFRGNRR